MKKRVILVAAALAALLPLAGCVAPYGYYDRNGYYGGGRDSYYGGQGGYYGGGQGSYYGNRSGYSDGYANNDGYGYYGSRRAAPYADYNRYGGY